MTSPYNNDNKVDFLSSSCKDTFSSPCNDKEPEDISLLLVPSLSSPISNSHSNNRKESQLGVPSPYPYPQQQPGEPSKKIATTQKKQQNTNSSSSVRSNSKKRATCTSDTNTNKEGVEKKRRRKSQEQHEDNNEENKIPKTGRPRWTREERYLLLKAILGEKKLEQMGTFRWECISQQVGKKKKTCKDQWKLELVPSFLDMFSETMGTNESCYSEEKEISDDLDEDTDECMNEMYWDIVDENEEHDNDNNKL